MRLALINPPSLFAYGKISSGHNCSFPLGLGYLASYLRKHGHEPRIYDPEAENKPLELMWSDMAAFKPDAVGVTAVTTTFSQAKALAEEAKKRFGCYVIMGGAHVTALPRSSLEAIPALDAVIRGEGELPLLALADYFEQHGKLDFAQIPGAAYLDGAHFVRVPFPPPIEDLDSLPYPARDLVDMRNYRLHGHFQRGKMSATILSSRGCPSKCTFCCNITMRRRFRPVSAAYFVGEMEHLIRDYGIRHFHIVDDCFSIDVGRVERICEMIIEKRLRITWFFFGRVNTLQDENLIQKLKDAGCVYILLGVESGSQTILDNMRKDITIDMIESCCRKLRKRRIHYFNSFIIGNEGDTRETVEKTIEFSIKLKSVMAGFNMMIPFPGTAIFNKYYRDYDSAGTDWKNWCSVADDIPYSPRHTELSRAEILKLTTEAYRRFYFNLPQLLRILGFVNDPRTLLHYAYGCIGLFRQMMTWRRKGGKESPPGSPED